MLISVDTNEILDMFDVLLMALFDWLLSGEKQSF